MRPPVVALALALALAGALGLRSCATTEQTLELPYSEFRQLLADGQVARVEVSERRIRGELVRERDGRTRFTTTRVDESLASSLADADVEVTGRVEGNGLGRLLAGLLPMLLFLGFWIFLMRRASGAGGGGPGGLLASAGRSKAKIFAEDDTRTRFEDVAGVDEAKQELMETVSFLRSPESWGRLGARMPRGVLLVGPPGTGKTLLARAVAGEAGVPFFSISGSEFVEMFVGVGAARVRDLFAQAREKAPCIVFVDELDALGRARGGLSSGGHDEKEQTLNQLLVEMDGFDATSGIVLLAATNRPEVLDPALLRPGRFDRRVLVDRPDREGRAAIVAVHLRRVTRAPGVDPARVAEMTPGMSGADLANLVNEAALLATRRDARHVEERDVADALERVVAGPERRSRVLRDREREIVAHHELGHALVAMALPETDPVHKISIIPRGVGALGYTLQRPAEDRFLATRDELEDRLAVLLGGRAAERVIYGHLSTGAADDLARASELAREMVVRFAMIPELGNATLAGGGEPGFLGAGPAPRALAEETAREIDLAVRRLVDRALARAEAILAHNRALLERAARTLLEREVLEDEDLRRLAAELAPVATEEAA